MTKEKKLKDSHSLIDRNSMKVVAIGCAAIVTALIIMSLTGILIMKDAVVHKLKSNDLYNLAESIGAVIEGRIDKAVDTSMLLAEDPVVQEWVTGEEKDTAEGSMVEAKLASTVNDMGYDTAFLVNNSTKHYWSYNKGSFQLLDTVSENDIADDWFFSTIRMNKKYAINIDHNKELNDTFVWINTLVGDIKSPAAVTGLGMNLSDVIDELDAEEHTTRIRSDLWLVDREGIIYLAKNQECLNRNMNEYLPQSLIKTMDKTGNPDRFEIAEYKNNQGKIYDLAYKNIKDTGWKIIVQIPRSESLSFLKAIGFNTIISCIIIILLMVAIFYFVSNRIANPYKRALLLNKQLENIVEERTKELTDKNFKIQDSLEYAQRIQKTILAPLSELNKYLKEYFIIYEPKDIVGGDFYWQRSFQEGFVLVVGDCTGHGVPGALMTTAVNAMLNQIVDETSCKNPSQILKELDRLMKQAFSREGIAEAISDGLDAAVLYISRTGKVLFAGANMSVYLSDSQEVHEIKGSRVTIDCGTVKKEKQFINHEIDSSVNDVFYVLTDGYKDQPGGEKKLPFGKLRLKALLKTVSSKSLEQQKAFIRSALTEYEGNEVRRDDITFIGFRL